MEEFEKIGVCPERPSVNTGFPGLEWARRDCRRSIGTKFGVNVPESGTVASKCLRYQRALRNQYGASGNGPESYWSSFTRASLYNRPFPSAPIDPFLVKLYNEYYENNI